MMKVISMILRAKNNLWITKPPDACSNKIKSYQYLSGGWNHGEGEPISKKTIEIALEFVKFAANKFLDIDSIPGAVGEIQLALYKRKKPINRYLEVTIESIDSINITKYEKENNEWRIKYDIDFDSLEESFNQIIQFKNESYKCHPTSEYYPKDNFFNTLEDSGVVPLKTIEAGYQLFKKNVLKNHPIHYATT